MMMSKLGDHSTRFDGIQYCASLKAMDTILDNICKILSQTGRLENTIVVGLGNHGEDPFKMWYARLWALDSHILHMAGYIYYPTGLVPDTGVREILRRNTKMLMRTGRASHDSKHTPWHWRRRRRRWKVPRPSHVRPQDHLDHGVRIRG
mmetsp:Transcript_41267/g.87940  ORF Transcript_41267/g.87940 Transcript_41267/m.87940 type:complete len:149 (-) Transcript_41267:34-480(-)